MNKKRSTSINLPIRFFLFFVILLIFNPKGFSQNKKEKRKHLKHEVIAENFYKDFDFANALENFLECYKIDSTDEEINYRIGVCYLSLSDYTKAKLFLKKVNESSDFDNHDIYYYLAKTTQLSHSFEKAITYYEKYLTFAPQKSESILLEIEKCKNGIAFLADSLPTKITNLGSVINSEYPDYGAVLNEDETLLIFTSERPSSQGGKKHKIDGSYHDDIYQSVKKDGEWTTPQAISNLNTTHDDAVVSLSHDGKKLIIYRGSSNLIHSSGHLYISILENGEWSTPEKLNHHINSHHRETSACFSLDDNVLYFTSDRPGGYGGLDIYKVSKKANGEWGTPVNLGPEINTPYDEESPFVHPDGKSFYFSSQGHKNMGGFDIFKATLSNDGSWINPTNLGHPINTANDDIYFTVSNNGKHIYFSSQRQSDCFGHEDIYKSSIEE